MCLGGSTKVSVPKPAPLPPPLPPPPQPKPAPEPPKVLQEPGKTPDIRIGEARTSTGQRNRNTQRTSTGKQSLSIGNNQGLNL